MILVIGGHASGKREYVKSIGYSEIDISSDVSDDRPVLYGLERIVDNDPAGSIDLLPSLLKKEIVVCDEVGSGIIPLERENRESREAAGRLCIELAKSAIKVVRLVAGIHSVIKG